MSVQRTYPIVPYLACLVLVACADAVGPDPAADSGFEHEIRGGHVHTEPIARPQRPDGLLEAPSIRAVLGPIEPRDLDETRRVVTTDASSRALVHVQLAQRLDGIPIHGAYLHLTVRPGDAGDARLLASSYHLYQGAHVDVAPAISSDGAEERARAALRAPADAPLHGTALEIWPIDGTLELVWNVALDGRSERALVRASGPRTGAVEVVDERVDGASGTITGWIATGGAPGGAGVARRVPLTDLAVHAGNATAYTSATGHFALTGPSAAVDATLAGRAARVVDVAGAAVGGHASASSSIALTLGDQGEGALAQVTAYQTVTDERAFLVANGFPTADLGAPLVARVNVDATCNAYFSPPDRTLNLFRAGGGCRNSAERSIIAHEYGHFVDDAYGGILDGGLSEGWGDALSCLLRGDPVIGPDLMAGRIIRTCDNDYQFPSDGQDEVHALGQAWAGFVWHARAGLVQALGATAGDAMIRKLVLPSLESNAADIPSAVREVFLRDDDDGDLRNGTPHWNILIAAARRHGLDGLVATDTSGPGAITDLRATATHAASVTLRWTAPADSDGGRAARYELRWSRSRITDSTFASATAVAAPRPAVPGHSQQLTIKKLPPGAHRIYVALRALDAIGNASPLSNVLAVDLGTPRVAFDGADPALWTSSGLWHATRRHVTDGASALWFGDEASGTYETGAASHGDLVSPEIDLGGIEHPVLSWSEWIDVEGDARFDHATVTVADVDDPSRSIGAERERAWSGDHFVERGLDLEELAGRRVRITFHFDSIDSAENQFAGWLVRDVELLADDPAPAPSGGLVINEVLADPPAAYDANGDGHASVTDDEMVELVDASTAPIDLGGCTLEDATRVRVTFPPGTSIAPRKALVVFGGGSPMLPGVATMVAPGGLILNNAGDTVRIRRPDGEVLAEISYGPEGGHDQSLVRATDGDPTAPLVGHLSVSTAPASPGLRSDGTAW